MTTNTAELVRDAVAGVSTVDRAENLSAIHGADCAAALWQRQMSPDLLDWMYALPPDQLPKARVIVRPDAVRNVALDICEMSGTPDGTQRTQLIDDVATLADVFAGLMGAKWLRLRFDVVTTNACRRFHIDAVTARLVCTYRGTGTQYGISTNGDDPTRISTVPTGVPIVLRGTLWPTQPKSGLLHRSPPIEGTGETRSVMVLDPVDDPEDEI
ncbi:DUF1826 domain-containing protein [Pseudaestuariivita rosea]|uniref:DUF1826 domain-containing protein n=1 Tax=Pseudaestuariivita rosea TaxID=2763263 RepID=UPI001ABB6CAA|nr:DUF1826 domain-containing protein [Pseudaestuariivita rosea]